MGSNGYYIVDKSILPDYFEKVIETKKLLSAGTVKEVSAAVKITGISRSTYYKYKDFIFEKEETLSERKAVFLMLLNHEKGVLSKVLTAMSDNGANIIAITQSPPIASRASVTLTCDISRLIADVPALLNGILEIPGVEQATLISME
ncbi:MAG: ACT domain-containing protein [Clostridia bacterium]|nr:ACT domain-containing protein [Clostridia bacterium]MBQ4157574.1 ACT domain-containing protein [Clostridia bacterium]MBQ4620854.1 ACT domain-containing protein [Clostridia bacterium]